MDSVITKLTEIENAASGILKGAVNAQDRLDQEQARRILTFDQELEQKTQAEITALQEQLTAKSEEELAKLRADSNAELAALDSMYTEKHQQLADEIYQRILRK